MARRPPDPPPDERTVRLSGHPRARRQIRLARGWAGVAGCAAAALAAAGAGLPAYDVALRALVAGVAASLVGWALAVTVWRQIAIAEVRAVARRVLADAEQGAEQR